ncbi:MAG: hypothetical protein OES24_09200 [Acidimicrobiia bacterium]|nr:hypothetical protein [Acidimicrobiia bacterium]
MPMPRELLDLLQPGDLLLSGGPNFFSEVTQLATGSRFGHVMVVLRDGHLIQATDIALTPPEDDEGVVVLSYEDLHERSSRLSGIRAVRPNSIDIGRLCRTADHLVEHSPTYPSVGAIVLGFCCAAARLVAGLPPSIKGHIVRYQFRLIADGPTRMHCAEFAFRLYAAAGVRVELDAPVLADVIDHSLRHRPELLELRLRRRRAASGEWPNPLPQAAAYGVHGSVTTFLARLDPGIARDHAGLVLPVDFERSPDVRSGLRRHPSAARLAPQSGGVSSSRSASTGSVK